MVSISRYRIISQIGKGGFGAVYKAEDTLFGNRFVAVKEMSQDGLNPQEITEATDAFKREALLLASLTHPNLPRIYDQFSDAGRWYLVMDFIEGETLEVYLNKAVARSPGGIHGLPLEEVLEIGIQLCTVHNYLHTRQPPIIFRDLKPANIMRTSDGHLYLIDFGIARHFKPGQAKDTIAFGSPGYAAPEQYGKAQTTSQADIFSLGATLHHLLTGDDPSDTPFTFAPLQTQGQGRGQPSPLDEFERLIVQMVNLNASKRPVSMAAIKQELQRIVSMETASKLTGHPESTLLQTPWPDNRAERLGEVSPSPATRSAQSEHDRQKPPMGSTIYTYRGHSTYRDNGYAVTSVAWSPDGSRVASGSRDDTVQVWDAFTGEYVIIYPGHSGTRTYVSAIAWSPRDTRIASGGGGTDSTVQVWDATNGGYIGTYIGHTERIVGVAWSPDSTRIASASNDGTVQIQNSMTGECLLKYGGHISKWRPIKNGVNAVTWSPDGTRIASGDDKGIVQVWDPSTGRTIFNYHGHGGAVYAVAWSPNGSYIASGGGWTDDTVQVWDAATGTPIFVYRGHSSSGCWVNTVAWSPDSRRIASGGGGDDTNVHIWDATNGGNVFIYRGHSDAVNAVVWSPDGTYIASGSADKTVQVWRAAP